jgi:hypothetical protein
LPTYCFQIKKPRYKFFQFLAERFPNFTSRRRPLRRPRGSRVTRGPKFQKPRRGPQTGQSRMRKPPRFDECSAARPGGNRLGDSPQRCSHSWAPPEAARAEARTAPKRTHALNVGFGDVYWGVPPPPICRSQTSQLNSAMPIFLLKPARQQGCSSTEPTSIVPGDAGAMLCV